jgi:hypothetical protein
MMTTRIAGRSSEVADLASKKRSAVEGNPNALRDITFVNDEFCGRIPHAIQVEVFCR